VRLCDGRIVDDVRLAVRNRIRDDDTAEIPTDVTAEIPRYSHRAGADA
jgi:hypothetical protein